MNELLNVSGVSKHFAMGGLFSRNVVNAVNDVSFTLSAERAEIFTIIGESGSGKTTLARMILGLETPSSGTIAFDEQRVSDTLSRSERLAFMKRLQPVFQNPFEAFNPLKQVDRYLRSTAQTLLGVSDPNQIDLAMDSALQKVGLSLKEIAGRYAHELSGGQLQRVAIARALIPEPALLIADEPVSMVDASLRMSIVNLLRDLRDTFGVSVIYITHDLATAYYISDRIMIMQQGHVVEMGPAKPILEHPEHPYSQLLKASVLSTDNAGRSDLQPADRSMVEAALGNSTGGVLVNRDGGRLVRLN
jgi:peptide/nickel transport system ATP-binding protein